MFWLDSHTLDLSRLLCEFNLWHGKTFPTTMVLDDKWKTFAEPVDKAWNAHGWLGSIIDLILGHWGVHYKCHTRRNANGSNLPRA